MVSFSFVRVAVAQLLLIELGVTVLAHQPRTVIQNAATGFVWDDLDAVSQTPGGAIISNELSEDLPFWQLWDAPAPSSVNGPFFKFVSHRRPLPGVALSIEAHADGLPGSSLTAQAAYGSIFRYVSPADIPVIYSFLFVHDEEPQLAITAGPALYDHLTLQPYNASNAYQQFVFYNPPALTARRDLSFYVCAQFAAQLEAD